MTKWQKMHRIVFYWKILWKCIRKLLMMISMALEVLEGFVINWELGCCFSIWVVWELVNQAIRYSIKYSIDPRYCQIHVPLPALLRKRPEQSRPCLSMTPFRSHRHLGPTSKKSSGRQNLLQTYKIIFRKCHCSKFLVAPVPMNNDEIRWEREK